MILKNLILETVAAGSVALASVAQDWDKVEVKTEALRGNLHVLYGAGGNIGISAGEDGIFIIDDQYAPLTDKIKAAIASISDKDVRFAINTHFHGDHSGGNENIGSSGTVIVAHDRVRQRMSEGAFVKAFNMTMEPQPKAALPVVTFNDEISLHLNGEEARIIHVKSAHTDGDSIIHFKGSNLIHMGDLFFNGLMPFIDVPNGGSVDGVIAGVDLALSMANDDTIVIPGHGPVTDKAGLADYRQMLQETRGIVAALKAEGLSLEEAQAKKPFAAFEAKWKPFHATFADEYVRFIYTSIE